MRMPRVLFLLLAGVGALWLAADSAAARSSRSNRGRNSRNDRGRGGRYRVMDEGDRGDREDRKKAEAKKRTEERRKKAEAKKKAGEDKKRKAEEKKKALEARRKEQIELAKKRKAGAKKAVAKRPSSADKNTDAEANEKEAGELYAAAEAEFNDGKLLPGVKLLRQTIEEYGGTDAAAGAERWLELLMSQEKYGALITLGEAEEAFGAERYRQAKNKFLTLLANYPKSEQAEAAKKRLAEIEEGDLLSKTKYTQDELEDARLWFLAGNIHLENGRQADAAGAYRRAIENYPGSPYAQQAAQKVAALR